MAARPATWSTQVARIEVRRLVVSGAHISGTTCAAPWISSPTRVTEKPSSIRMCPASRRSAWASTRWPSLGATGAVSRTCDRDVSSLLAAGHLSLSANVPSTAAGRRTSSGRSTPFSSRPSTPGPAPGCRHRQPPVPTSPRSSATRRGSTQSAVLDSVSPPGIMTTTATGPAVSGLRGARRRLGCHTWISTARSDPASRACRRLSVPSRTPSSGCRDEARVHHRHGGDGVGHGTPRAAPGAIPVRPQSTRMTSGHTT